MGFLDALKSVFVGHGSASAGSVKLCGPVPLATAKKALARVIVQQPLLSMRQVAEALHDLQAQTPALVTFTMDHYFNNPKVVRFQNSGGKQLDVDAIVSLHAEPGVLADTVTIQHLLDDIDDRRGHQSADAEIGHIDCSPLANATAEVFSGAQSNGGNGDAGNGTVRNWLFALLDQLDTIAEVTSSIAPLASALGTALPKSGLSDQSDAAAIRTALVDALRIDNADLRSALGNPAAATTVYLPALEILKAHGIEVPATVALN